MGNMFNTVIGNHSAGIYYVKIAKVYLSDIAAYRLWSDPVEAVLKQSDQLNNFFLDIYHSVEEMLRMFWKIGQWIVCCWR